LALAVLVAVAGVVGVAVGAPVDPSGGTGPPSGPPGFVGRTLPASVVHARSGESPALVAAATGSLELWWRDNRPPALHGQRFADGGWSAPTTVDRGRPVVDASGIGAAVDPGTGTVLTALVASGRVWTRTRMGDDWSAWASVSGAAAGAPAVAALGDERFAVVVRDRSDRLHARFVQRGRWGTWRELGLRATTSPAAAAQADGTLVVAAADGRRRVLTTTVAAGGKPARWRSTGLTTALTPGLAVDPGDGAWHLVVRGPDAAAWGQVGRSGGRMWDRPVRIGARLRSGPAVAAWGAGHLDAVAVGADGRLVQMTSNDGRWAPPRPVAPLSVSPRTKVVGGDAVTGVSGDPTGTRTVTFAASATPPAVGDILVASATDATPDGLLARVTQVRPGPDGTTTVVTGPATLPEAVANGSINLPLTLSADDVASAPNGAARSAAPLAAAAGALSQNIRRNVSCSQSATATISGAVSVEPSFRFTASWSLFGGVQAVSFTGTVTESADLRASIDGQASCSLRETPLLSQPVRFKPIVFTVGPVPVVITPELQLYLDANGSVQAALTTSATQSTSVSAGLSYDGGTVRPTSQLTSSFTYAPPAVTSGARIEAGVAPKFGLLLYGVTGPRFDTRATVRFDADPAHRPNWTLRGALTGGIQLVIPALGVSAGKSDIIRFEQVIAQGDFTGAPPPPPPPPPAGTKTISADADPFPGCGTDNRWTFVLGDVGGNTGITPPAVVTASTTTGGTVTLPLSPPAGGGGVGNTARYQGGAGNRLNGQATAVIDQRWNPTFPYFSLIEGPCVATTTTLTGSASTARVGNQVTLSGRLTTAGGTPLTGRTLTIRWHSPSRDGKGAQLGPFTTDANGRFSTTVTVDEAGRHSFTAEYNESGPLQRGERASEAAVIVAVT
jgi:hypothetical protein